MIYTVTFNPSLDYVIQVDKLVPGIRKYAEGIWM